jgi:signal transduction histidine kinase/CheY-like chemotaxis protein
MLPSRLALSYARWISLVVTLTVIATGLMGAYFAYGESQRTVFARQQAELLKGAFQIDRFVAEAVRDIERVARMVDSGHLRTAEQMQVELHRLLAAASALTEVSYLDSRGSEQVRLARFAADVVGSGIDRSAEPAFVRTVPGKPYFGGTTYYKGSEPKMTIAVRPQRAGAGVIVGELSLKPVWKVVTGIRFGSTGYAYVVDQYGHLVAHPDINRVLARRDPTDLAHVRVALQESVRSGSGSPIVNVMLEGTDEERIASFQPLAGLPWTIVTEQARSEAHAPVLDSLLRSTITLGVAVLLGFGVSLLLAWRAARPITALKEGALRIGQGDLAHRISPGRRDELGELAQHLNDMAAKLEASHRLLEAQVEERTRDLVAANRRVNEQSLELEALNAELLARLGELASEKEEAERANLAKTRFLAAASHDLRQPMHTVALLVAVLSQHPDPEEAAMLVRKIQSAVRSMEGLFKSLLDITKLDARAVQPERRAFRAGDLLDSIAAQYASQARDRGLALRVHPSRAVVESDPVLLERILGNLVSNALRYTQRGRVLVGCRRRKSSLALEVWDTGPGIAEVYHEEIFEEFVRLGTREREEDGGLGLGLSIVKRTASLLGHAIRVRSCLGKGSMFAVEVPRVPAAVSADDAASVGDVALRALPGSFVVIVDDDEEACFATASAFRHWGCHTIAAHSIDAMVSLLSGYLRTPDLIVSDLRLGGESTGLEAVERIRVEAESAIPAVIVTGDVCGADPRRLREAGIAILYKPVDPRALGELAEALLANRSIIP